MARTRCRDRFCTRPAPDTLLSGCTWAPSSDGTSTSYGGSPVPALAFDMPSRSSRCRLPVLASLTTSQTLRLSQITPAAARLRIGHTHLLPALFSHEQMLLSHILEDYMKTDDGFPRACPLCNDNHFMMPAAGSAGREGVIKFSSRPWSCTQCARWFHLGCLGVAYMEDVPVKPFLHCKACRDLFVGIEVAAQRGEHPGPTPRLASRGYSWSLATEVDHHRLLEDGEAGTLPGARRSPGQLERAKAKATMAGRGARGSGSSSDDPGARSNGSADGLADPDDYASRLLAVYLVLADAFSPAVLDTVAEASTEYEGGKYSMLLRHRGLPVSAATFNVYGPELAQVCLLATAADARRAGHGRALMESLEHFLISLGVENLVMQPRQGSLDLWVERFGFTVLHPTDVWRLYQQAPLPFFDCPVLSKPLLGE